MSMQMHCIALTCLHHFPSSCRRHLQDRKSLPVRADDHHGHSEQLRFCNQLKLKGKVFFYPFKANIETAVRWSSIQSLSGIFLLTDAGVWRLNLGLRKPPPPIWDTFSTPDPKNGSQPHNSPRLWCYSIKIPQKLCLMCWNWQLFVQLFCLPIALDRVPPYETRPILTNFPPSRPDQMLFDCKK